MFKKLWYWFSNAGPIIWGALVTLLFIGYEQVDHYSHPTYQKYKNISHVTIERDSLGIHQKITRRYDSVYTYSTATDIILHTDINQKIIITTTLTD